MEINTIGLFKGVNVVLPEGEKTPKVTLEIKGHNDMDYQMPVDFRTAQNIINHYSPGDVMKFTLGNTGEIAKLNLDQSPKVFKPQKPVQISFTKLKLHGNTTWSANLPLFLAHFVHVDNEIDSAILPKGTYASCWVVYTRINSLPDDEPYLSRAVFKNVDLPKLLTLVNNGKDSKIKFQVVVGQIGDSSGESVYVADLIER